MFRGKRAEMGVGTLIVFIAMLLVAAVAAGVLIQTASSLQEKSLATGHEARAQISTNAQVIEVSATDGRDASVNHFEQILSLSPGSDPIKLDDTILTLSTTDTTATMKYRGEGGVCENNNQDGYNTLNVETFEGLTNESWVMLENDYDDDGQDDSFKVGSGTEVSFNLSSVGIIGITIPDISGASEEGVELDVEEEELTDGENVYAYVSITGETNTNNTLDDNVEIKIEPARVGEGYFTAVYHQEGRNHREGVLSTGDIVKLCYESPGDIVEEESVRVNFIPKIGTPTRTEFTTPDVVITQKVYLYP